MEKEQQSQCDETLLIFFFIYQNVPKTGNIGHDNRSGLSYLLYGCIAEFFLSIKSDMTLNV